MQFWLYLFLASSFIVFYNYAGYALIVILANKLSHKNSKAPALKTYPLPSISFIVAAYNEEDCIDQKITNTLELDYPREKIEFLFISDGSDDRTEAIVKQYPSIRSLHQPERRGKSAALNRAVAAASHEILIFSDANTLLNKEAVRHIARHYAAEKIGGVAGEKKVLSSPAGKDEVGGGEGLYWKYESFLKKTDSAFYSVVGAAGELFSFRSSLFEAIPDNVILDDFVSSLKVAQKGYRIVYEPDAYAIELPSLSMQDEKKRKVRIAAGGFQAISLLAPLLAFWKYPRLSFLYISHRVLRWALSPFCLVLAFISNGLLVLYSAGPPFSFPTTPFTILFLVQLCFYGLAAMASLIPSLSRHSRLAKLAYYFTFMNVCAILGFFRFLRGNQKATWEKAKRATA
jgi:cellulose synthase/poly-beta-1,6-N-acetylglucosamine synthase-like glycosyltransferase